MLTLFLVVFVVSLELVGAYFGIGLRRHGNLVKDRDFVDSHIDASISVLRTGLQNQNRFFSTIHSKQLETSKVSRAPAPITFETDLPWTQSINPSRTLTYMPMLDETMEVLKSLGAKKVNLEDEVSYRTSAVKPARIGNMCFKTDVFRKIRLTYFDGGDAVQVYNTVFYPSYEYDLPILGVDLISLGKNRVLNVVDFQPLHPSQEYSDKFINHLTPIREKYPELQGTLSGKIYDDTSFFSKNMLFGRFTDESRIGDVVAPAFSEYLEAYISMAKAAVPDGRSESMEVVAERQRRYDEYSALKDPAVGLFTAYFGDDWTDKFVHDFLFSLSRESSAQELLTPDSSENSLKTASSQRVHSFKISESTGEVITTIDPSRPRVH